MYGIRVKIGDGLIWIGMKIRQLCSGLAALCAVAIPVVLLGGLFGDATFPVPFGGSGDLWTYVWQDLVLLVGLWWMGRLLIPAAIMAAGQAVWPSHYRNTVSDLYERAMEAHSRAMHADYDHDHIQQHGAADGPSFRESSARWRDEYNA